MDALDAVDMVKGSFLASGQSQIIVGPGIVEKVYEEVIESTGLTQASKAEVSAAGAEKLNPAAQFAKIFVDIFVPLLTALVTADLLMGINNLITAPDIFFDGQSVVDNYPGLADCASIINLIASTPFLSCPSWSDGRRSSASVATHCWASCWARCWCTRTWSTPGARPTSTRVRRSG